MEKKLTRNDAVAELLRLLDLFLFGSFQGDEEAKKQVLDNIKLCRSKIAELDKLKFVNKEERARARFKENLGL